MLNRILKTELINWKGIENLQPDNIKIQVNREALRKSLIKHGFVQPFYGWENKGKVYMIDGHERKSVLSELENVPELLPCTFIDAKNKAEAVKILVEVYNQKHNPFDKDILIEYLEMENIEVEEIDIESLNVSENNDEEIYNKKEAEEDDYEIPEVIKTDIAHGDLFQIGRHRLLCGDSTKKQDVERLMNLKKADLIFTDPPYELETSDIYLLFNEISLNTNILIFASDKQFPFIFKANLGEFKRLYVLDTNIASPTNNDVYVNHIGLLRFKIGDATKFQNMYNGGRSIIKMDYRKNLKDEKFEHKHQKSLETIGLFINYWSIESQIVVDLFGGSGSTMAACEQLNRICYTMEFSPEHCQRIINRMKKIYNLNIKKL